MGWVGETLHLCIYANNLCAQHLSGWWTIGRAVQCSYLVILVMKMLPNGRQLYSGTGSIFSGLYFRDVFARHKGVWWMARWTGLQLPIQDISIQFKGLWVGVCHVSLWISCVSQRRPLTAITTWCVSNLQIFVHFLHSCLVFASAQMCCYIYKGGRLYILLCLLKIMMILFTLEGLIVHLTLLRNKTGVLTITDDHLQWETANHVDSMAKT